jgi:HAD superfamily hydrolase (TIGR01490 family)
LIRWQLYHAIADRLVKLGFVDATAFNSIRLARMEWKKRNPNASFKSYEIELIKSYEAALLQLTPGQLSSAVDSVFDEYKDQVYVYTRQLINDLKAKGYRLFAISGSQSEIIDKIAPYYGFEAYIGTTYEQIDGKFTGKKIFHAQHKDTVLSKMIKDYDLDLDGSFAVGDSSSDISMLEMVENPIAFNPEDTLFKHARAKGWKVVVERKNVIYELEDKDGTYVLA